MPSSPLTPVRRAYAALARRDLPAIAACLAPDIECVLSDEAPYGGVWRGRDDAARALASLLDQYEDLRVEVTELLSSGDTVVALGNAHGRALGGGNLWQPFAHVLRMRDGQIRHFVEYADSVKRLRALGLFPPGAG